MKRSHPIDISGAQPPGLARRLGAILYDSLLILALLMLAATALTLAMGRDPETDSIVIRDWLLSGLWTLIPPLYFLFFWCFGGQTPGMRPWRILLVCEDGSPLSVKDALLRLIAALLSWVPLGLGFLWSLTDQQRRTWHDRLSHTRLVMLR